MALPPVSITTFIYSRFDEKKVDENGVVDSNYLDDNDKDSLIMSISKRVARFAILIIFVPFITPWAIFYNTCGIFLNGSLTFYTHIIKITFLDNTSEYYLNMLHLCIAYAIKDMVINLFFIGFISLLYTFDSHLGKKLDASINSSIRYLCTTLEDENQNLIPENDVLPKPVLSTTNTGNLTTYHGPVNNNLTFHLHVDGDKNGITQLVAALCQPQEINRIMALPSTD